MAAQPEQTSRLVVTLDRDRTLQLDRISTESISRLVERIAPRERSEATIDVAAFNSSI